MCERSSGADFAGSRRKSVTAEIVSMGGGTAYARRLPFDRYLRDARAGVVMGITNDTVLSNIARMLFPGHRRKRNINHAKD
jgi:alkylation response protein AidB-like acyl-CoA dehydrogenase